MSLDEDEFEELKLIVNTATGNPSLTEWERGFIASFAERIEEYGDNTRVSTNQWTHLRKIYENKC